MLESLWDNLWIVLVNYVDGCGSVLGSVWDRFWIGLGSFWHPFGIV